MEVAVMASLFAKRDMNIETRHGVPKITDGIRAGRLPLAGLN